MTPITYFWLRTHGWRIVATNTSPEVHMVYQCDRKLDTCLEIARCGENSSDWNVWLRSDLAHSRCRFCFLRVVYGTQQVASLIRAITDVDPPYEYRDEDEFNDMLAACREESKRHYAEYCKNDRWSYLPA